MSKLFEVKTACFVAKDGSPTTNMYADGTPYKQSYVPFGSKSRSCKDLSNLFSCDFYITLIEKNIPVDNGVPILPLWICNRTFHVPSAEHFYQMLCMLAKYPEHCAECDSLVDLFRVGGFLADWSVLRVWRDNNNCPTDIMEQTQKIHGQSIGIIAKLFSGIKPFVVAQWLHIDSTRVKLTENTESLQKLWINILTFKFLQHEEILVTLMSTRPYLLVEQVRGCCQPSVAQKNCFWGGFVSQKDGPYKGYLVGRNFMGADCMVGVRDCLETKIDSWVLDNLAYLQTQQRGWEEYDLVQMKKAKWTYLVREYFESKGAKRAAYIQSAEKQVARQACLVVDWFEVGKKSKAHCPPPKVKKPRGAPKSPKKPRAPKKSRKPRAAKIFYPALARDRARPETECEKVAKVQEKKMHIRTFQEDCDQLTKDLESDYSEDGKTCHFYLEDMKLPDGDRKYYQHLRLESEAALKEQQLQNAVKAELEEKAARAAAAIMAAQKEQADLEKAALDKERRRAWKKAQKQAALEKAAAEAAQKEQADREAVASEEARKQAKLAELKRAYKEAKRAMKEFK